MKNQTYFSRQRLDGDEFKQWLVAVSNRNKASRATKFLIYQTWVSKL